jgi:hypothetical protein
VGSGTLGLFDWSDQRAGAGHDEVAAPATGPRAVSKSAFPRYRDKHDDEADESFVSR